MASLISKSVIFTLNYPKSRTLKFPRGDLFKDNNQVSSVKIWKAFIDFKRSVREICQEKL